MNYPTNTDDVIDSRDVIAVIEELESDDETSADDDNELAMLRLLATQGEASSADWQYGATLIRDSYFEDYAMELAEDLGVVPSEYTWPTSYIDWEQAAGELQMDYTSVDFDGVTYWVR